MVSDDLVAMTESLQQPGYLQDLVGVVPASTNDAGSMAAWRPTKGVRGNSEEESLAMDPNYLSLMCYVGHTHAFLVT